MNTLKFLRRVLPTEGLYCRFTISANGLAKRNKFYGTLEELEAAILESDQQGQTTFFSISSFQEDTRRTKTNVHKTRVLTLDVDCGPTKAYPNWKEGLKVLLKFVTDMKLPKPMIVGSGNGLHVYWVLDQDLTPDEWNPLAEAMKKATEANDFEVDRGPTANISQVLRPVGTHNYKDPTNPKDVKLLVDGGDTTRDAMRKALAYYYVPGSVSSKPKNNGLLDSLSVQQDFPPAIGSLIAEKCQQINWAVENQDKVSEPIWYAMIGVAAFCENPEDTAKLWSQGHPSYSESETINKLNHWRSEASGPTTCAKFENERPAGCKGCPFAGKIGSPARLGVRYVEVDTSADAPDDVITDIQIPKPFKRTKVGIVATVDDTDIKVADFDIYPLSYGYDESLGYEVAQFMWDRPHVGWKVLTLRQAYLADGTYREFVGTIADQGIVLETKRQTEYFQIMLRSYMNELRKVRTVTNHYSTMGWKDDHTLFVLGDDLYRRDTNGVVSKETIRLTSTTTRVGSDLFTTKGDFDTWFKGTTALRKGNLNAHQLSIGLGLASILVEFTGLKGVTVSFYGPSGSGKSLAQLMQQSLWGNPEKLHFQSKFTQNALFGRFGTYGHLPLTVDEATQMSDKDVGDFLYEVTQGRDKARLTRTTEERAPREWALISTLSTNKPIASKLISGGFETDAQLARLLELRVDPSPIFSDATDAGRKLHRLFTENYGWAGRKFLHKVMEIGEQGIRAMVANAMDNFEKKYGKKFAGVERYWEVAFVLADLAMRLAHEWDIIDYTPEQAINWALDQVDDMRDAIKDNQLDMFDLVAEYLNEVAAETVRVFHVPNKDPEPDYNRVPRGTIRARIDAHRTATSTKITNGVLLLDKTHFRQWFAKKGGNPRELMTRLKLDRADATPKSGKASLGKNTPISLPQSYVIGIRLTHPRMAGILDETIKAYDELTFGELVSVPKDANP